MKKIAAGIVLYNPNAERFTACLTKLIKQLDRIYIYDNNEISNVVINSNKIVYISEKQNKRYCVCVESYHGESKRRWL